jgi:hypothetical protein
LLAFMGKNVSDGDAPPQNTTQGGLYHQILPPTHQSKLRRHEKGSIVVRTAEGQTPLLAPPPPPCSYILKRKGFGWKGLGRWATKSI